jgi:hypothetical protein
VHRHIFTIFAIPLFLAMLSGQSASADLSSDEDPRYNSSINPNHNSSINPKYNSSINPRYNSSINPLYNSELDPRYNSSINPIYNSSISPTSGSWSGFYLFNFEGDAIGLVVFVINKTLLAYSASLDWTGNLHFNSEGGLNWFDKEGEWIDYAQVNGETGYNLFALEGEWIAFID